jgi:membrane-bound inhibitor of C-type lysozyme
MIKIILTFAMLTALLFASCKENTKQDKQETTKTGNKTTTTDEIITTSSTDKDGAKLDITFNNTKKTATLKFKGETIEMRQDTSASGIKYSNVNYIYREHQGNIELVKDGKVLFKK